MHIVRKLHETTGRCKKIFPLFRLDFLAPFVVFLVLCPFANCVQIKFNFSRLFLLLGTCVLSKIRKKRAKTDAKSETGGFFRRIFFIPPPRVALRLGPVLNCKIKLRKRDNSLRREPNERSMWVGGSTVGGDVVADAVVAQDRSGSANPAPP